jgi:6-phosphofructo-2-kinase
MGQITCKTLLNYSGMDPTVAKQDFKDRIQNYERVYETIGEEEEKQGIAYIKVMINLLDC